MKLTRLDYILTLMLIFLIDKGWISPETFFFFFIKLFEIVPINIKYFIEHLRKFLQEAWNRFIYETNHNPLNQKF